MRSLPLLLTLPLVVACGQVTDSEPSGLSAGGPSESPAGRGAPPRADAAGATAVPSAGRSGGNQPATAVDAGMARTDASTTPAKPAADGGDEEADAGSAVADPLCDGSDAMRFAYASEGGGPLYPTFGFTNPYGHAFLAIDGKCRYYVGQNYMRGITSGTLTASEAAQISADLHWQELDGWATWGIGKDAACPDAGVVSLMKAKAGAGCSCGCDPTAPAGLGEALMKAYEWMEKLASAGKPLDGPMSAVVLEMGFGGPPNQPKFAWPLSRSIQSIPNLLVDQSDPKLWMGSGPWARFDDPAEFTKLRDLRTKTTMQNPSAYTAGDVLVMDGGKQYSLFVRDELPTETENAWKALRATVPLP